MPPPVPRSSASTAVVDGQPRGASTERRAHQVAAVEDVDHGAGRPRPGRRPQPENGWPGSRRLAPVAWAGSDRARRGASTFRRPGASRWLHRGRWWHVARRHCRFMVCDRHEDFCHRNWVRRAGRGGGVRGHGERRHLLRIDAAEDRGAQARRHARSTSRASTSWSPTTPPKGA